MKRNVEIIERILELVEEHSTLSESTLKAAIFHGYSYRDVKAHALLCQEAGLVTTDQMDQVNGLTWNGHNVLAKLRGDRVL